MAINLLLCVVGFVILIYAADKLVEGSSNLAMSFGVSKTVVGLTIVAAGTSLPELVVSINASLKGSASLSLGNVVGSNIMNIALILGVAALICPIVCERAMIKRDTPIMIGGSALLWYTAYTDNTVSSYEGILFLVLFFSYFVMTYVIGKKEADAEKESRKEEETPDDKPIPSNSKNVMFIIGGFIGLVGGAELLVRGAVAIAQSVGVSDEIIGLTLVAIGTSLPELATSIIAARKGQSGIALGNVVGSNIFNILAIVGTAATIPFFSDKIAPLTVSSDMLKLHLPIMLVTAIALLPIMKTGMKITRFEGAILTIGYISYTVMLVCNAGTAN